MFHCIKQCFDKKSVQWFPGDSSETIPDGMELYFKEGPPVEKEPDPVVYLSQFVRPAFEVNPDGIVPISQYGKPAPKKEKVSKAKAA